jgi:hypothetical protein
MAGSLAGRRSQVDAVLDDDPALASKSCGAQVDPAIVARALHVLGVVLWICGVAFVTTVLLPSVRRMKSPEERVAFF